MTISTLPTTSYIRIESRLRPEQVNTSFTGTAAFDADIEARITKYAAVINNKLSRVENTPNNQKIATEALALRVLASLYGSSGYLNPAYWERAQALKAESADLIDDLLGTGTDEGSNASTSNAATFSTSPYVYDANGTLVVNG